MGIVYRPEPTPPTQQPPNTGRPWPDPDKYPLGTIWKTFWSQQYWQVERIYRSNHHMWVWIPASAVPEPYERGVSIPE